MTWKIFFTSRRGRVHPKLQVLCPNGTISITNCFSRHHKPLNFTLVNFMTSKIFFPLRRGAAEFTPNFESFFPTVHLATNSFPRLYRAITFTLFNFTTWKFFSHLARAEFAPNFRSFVPTVQFALPTAFQRIIHPWTSPLSILWLQKFPFRRDGAEFTPTFKSFFPTVHLALPTAFQGFTELQPSHFSILGHVKNFFLSRQGTVHPKLQHLCPNGSISITNCF
jgi:hypothetical protein